MDSDMFQEKEASKYDNEKYKPLIMWIDKLEAMRDVLHAEDEKLAGKLIRILIIQIRRKIPFSETWMFCAKN